MKKKVDDLSGDELNLAVAKALNIEFDTHYGSIVNLKAINRLDCIFDPVNNWNQCGKIMEDNLIETGCRTELGIRYFFATISGVNEANEIFIVSSFDKDLKTAICRCFVKSVFGDEVEL